MSQYQKILVLLSAESSHDQAIGRASLLARASRAELVIQLCIDALDGSAELHDDALVEQLQRKARANRQRWLEETLEQLRAQGFKASGTVVRGHPLRESMLAAILEHEPDLCIKSVHHESALKRLFFTPDDWYLARFSPAPLLIVAAAEARLPQTLLVAVDVGSDSTLALNRAIIGEATRYALQVGADMHLVYVSRPVSDALVGAGLVGGVIAADLIDEVEHGREARFARLADEFGVPANARHFVAGRVDSQLVAVADRLGAGLIVVGNNQRSGLDRFLLGSTTEDLLAHTHSDVLMVKPAGFDDNLLEMSGLGGASELA